MELTAKTLQDVTFGAKYKGYDPAEVDDFIAMVAEGVEELHERLRRASERAARAEQQVAEQPEANGSAAPTTSAASAAEISKVWERAAEAAEAAVQEAKREAERILDEARAQAESQLTEASQHAEATIAGAQEEARRISDESQGQLRIEIARLEEARDKLKSDADSLAQYLDGELGRVRETLSSALAAIETGGSSAAPAPELQHVDVPGAVPAASQWSDDQPEEQGGWNGPAPEASGSEVADQAVPEDQPAWGEQPAWHEGAQAHADEIDPFLAELRRAVQEEGPLGPRDHADSGDDGELYSDDPDDDKSGFFRRKK